MELQNFELRKLLADAMEMGYKRCLMDFGHLTATITKSEAYRMYGRNDVDKWIREKAIIPVKAGSGTSKIKLDRIQLELLNKIDRLTPISWLKMKKAIISKPGSMPSIHVLLSLI